MWTGPESMETSRKKQSHRLIMIYWIFNFFFLFFLIVFNKLLFIKEYKIIIESIVHGHDKDSKAQVYLVIHGDHIKTGKIELNDGKFEKSSIDNYEFVAPDVGKVNIVY